MRHEIINYNPHVAYNAALMSSYRVSKMSDSGSGACGGPEMVAVGRAREAVRPYSAAQQRSVTSKCPGAVVVERYPDAGLASTLLIQSVMTHL